MQALMMFLVFVLGYLTCRVAHYLLAGRQVTAMLGIGHLYSLYLLTRALESYEHSRQLFLKDLKKGDMSQENVSIYERHLEEEIERFKTKSIHSLLGSQPEMFHHMAPYKDWKSGMLFLEENKGLITTGYLNPEVSDDD
jgi:hypothetical protein